MALILKSKSIRFGRLDKVNDPTEGESADFESLAPNIFISCWTSNTEENFALWNMYTPQMRGVRLELLLPIFESYQIGEFKNRLVPENKCVDEENNLFILPGENEPEEIEYTDDNFKLKPKIETDIGLRINKLGHFKRKIWALEKEFRYRLNIYPTDPQVESEVFLDGYNNLVGKKTPSIDGYLIPIKEESFAKMRIRTSPKLLNGDFEIINALAEKYNPTATMEMSLLKGLIR